MANPNKKHKLVSYAKYGYIFILPFFLVYLTFQIYPLATTFYWSLFSYTKRNMVEKIEFAGIQNFLKLLGLVEGEKPYFLQYLLNTIIMWMIGFIPQIVLSLIMAAWLSNDRVKLPARGLTKIMIYMPNIITAASISILFYNLFTYYGPVAMLLRDTLHWTSEEYNFMNSAAGSRGLIGFINFWMWYGNTSLLLISGMMGINPSLYEAAEIDGANGGQRFFRITLPLLKPILLFTLVTSAIGGLQMYDIPSLFNVIGSSMDGGPNGATTTVTMYIMRLYSTSVGRAAAVSVMLFVVTMIISVALFMTMGDKDAKAQEKLERQRRKEYKKSLKMGGQ